MWEAAQGSSINEMDVSGGEMGTTLDLSSPDAMCRRSDQGERPDPDEGKSRATVRQYSALIAQKVMTHLEGPRRRMSRSAKGLTRRTQRSIRLT